MKQKILWSICAMFLCFGTGCPAASFDDLWKQVEKYERQDLPKSAYKVVGQIAAKADKEQQKGQRMAALLYGCKLRQDIVPDSFYSDIMKLERLKRQTADEVQRAVLASVLGELYEDNANRNRNYSDRTDAHPDSIREWSWEQFMKVSSENYLLSMARPDLLAAAKAADYMPFVEKGKDAGYFGGDLLNVIGRRAVQARANKGEGSYALDTVYARMLAVYRARGNREAELLVSVDSVAFALERGDVELAGQTGGLSPEETERVVLQSPAYKAYERLLSCFGDLPLSAEVYLGMLDLEVTPGTKVAWAEEGYAKYKAYPRAKELLNRKRQLEAPFVFLRFPAEVYPGVPNEYVVEHRNVAGMSLSWYQLPDGFPKAEARRAEYRKDEAAYARKYGVLRKTDRLNWQAQPAFLQVEDTFRLACPGVGYFVVVGKADGVASSDGKMVASFRASRFEVVAGDLPDSTSLCTVVDAQTGAPVPSATVEWCAAKDVVYSTQTDAEGKARWNFADYRKKHADRYSLSIKVRKGDDRYKYEHSCTFRQPYRTDDGTHGEERLYTDRAVYRPGQTVYIGGLCWDRKNDREQAAGGRKVVLALRDPNGKTVAEQTVESDEWGTFSATFALPVKGLSGRYAVRTGNNSVGFTVEEYKRPTFEVRLDEITARYQAGDTLCLAGTAMGYNGVPLRQARVTAVSVVGSWFYRVDRGGEEIPIDTVYTGEDGRFTLRVPVREAGRRGPRYGARQFVDVSVMGASGETQTAKTSFPLNEESLRLTLEVGTYWTKDSLPALKAVVQTNQKLKSYSHAGLFFDYPKVLCKPPVWCRIEAPHRRYYIWPERIAPRKKMPVGRKSVSCCRWQTSAAWTTSRICSRRPLPSSWRTAWRQSWRTSWATANTTTGTKTRTTAATATAAKTLRTSFGDVEVSVPRDRKGEFEPQVLKKNQTSISQDIEEKILSMYAKGMTTGDIEAHIQDIYGISVSDSTVSRITDKILPIAKEWQQRPLESIYAVVFLDAIHYHVRSEGQIVKKAVYIAIGIDLDGRKDVLGMWVGENESAKFWATVLNGLKNRGVEDIFIACTDNLTGFDAAIHATFPQTEIQNCIIHQLRNSSKYVSYKDLKALMADLKAVYAAVDEQAALDALDAFGERWDKKYPKISQSWRANWANLSTYFKYPQEVRRLIYTTNAIEGFNRQLRKVTKAKSVFPTDDSLLKMLYLAMMDITKKWTGRRQDWSLIHAQMAIYFAERMPE